jgi:hypothetical protein
MNPPSGANIYIYMVSLSDKLCCFQGDSTELGGQSRPAGSCRVFKFGHDSDEYECGD